MQLNAVDVVAVLFVALHVVLSWRRGLSDEVGRLLGALAALVLGWLYCAAIGEWLTRHTRLEGRPATLVGFVGTVLVVMLAAFLVSFLVSRIFKLGLPERADHVLGGVAGLVKGAVYTVVIFLALNLWPHEYLNRQFGEESLIGSSVLRIVPSVREKIQALDIETRLRNAARAADDNADDKAARRSWYHVRKLFRSGE